MLRRAILLSLRWASDGKISTIEVCEGRHMIRIVASAWVEDIKPLGDNYSNEDRSHLVPFVETNVCEGLVPEHPPGDDEIILKVGELYKDKELQMLLMLDEADNFLNRMP